MILASTSSLARLSNADLMAEVERLAHCERDATAALIAHLAELDARRLYLGAGFSSLFAYCTGALGLSEAEAYNRIEAARAARRFPVILDRLRAGWLNLTAIRLLAPHLTGQNHEELLAGASGKGRREVEALLAGRFPQPPVPSSIRKLPERKPTMEAPLPDALAGGETPATVAIEARAVTPTPPLGVPPAQPTQPPPSRRAVVAPLASDQYKIAFTARAQTYQKLRLAQDLLRHEIPDGDLAEVFDRALSALLQELARKKLGASEHPRQSRGTAPGSRHVPARVKRAVWLRDGGRCAFLAKSGRRCCERGFLEFHHLEPYAEGGEATVQNIALRCRSHSGYEAELHFGTRKVPGGLDTVRESPTRYGRDERCNSFQDELATASRVADGRSSRLQDPPDLLGQPLVPGWREMQAIYSAVLVGEGLGQQPARQQRHPMRS